MGRTALLLLALALTAPAALALNMNGFKEAPLTRLTQDELKAFRAAVMKVLDESPDGATVEWKADKTKFTSRITPRSTHTDGKLKCREAVVESDAHDRFQRGLYSFCKAGNGEWQFKSRPAAKK